MSLYEADELAVIDVPLWRVEPSVCPVTSIEYSHNGAFVAFSAPEGRITVASSFTGETKVVIDQRITTQPIADLRFHPGEETCVLTAYRDGHLVVSDATTGALRGNARHLGSNVTTMNIDGLGEAFALGCADGSVRLYDVEYLQRTKTLVKMVSRASTQTVSIFSIKYHPEDSNMLLAAGWYDRVVAWDMRSGNVERTIIGPHVRGSGLDLHGDTVLTGSSRDNKQIEMWDIGSCRKIRDVPVVYPTGYNGSPLLVTSVRFSRNGLNIIAGGAGYSVVQAFEATKGRFFGTTRKFSSLVSSCALSPFGSSFVVGCDNGEMVCQAIRLKPMQVK